MDPGGASLWGQISFLPFLSRIWMTPIESVMLVWPSSHAIS